MGAVPVPAIVAVMVAIMVTGTARLVVVVGVGAAVGITLLPHRRRVSRKSDRPAICPPARC